MPITTTKAVSDPYARISWATSIVLVAIQKLKLKRPVGTNESDALSYVAGEMELLSQASQLGPKESVPSNLRRSFCTLVAIQEAGHSRDRISGFGATGTDLNRILEHIRAGAAADIPESILNSAQGMCADLLENLNQRRPTGEII